MVCHNRVSYTAKRLNIGLIFILTLLKKKSRLNAEEGNQDTRIVCHMNESLQDRHIGCHMNDLMYGTNYLSCFKQLRQTWKAYSVSLETVNESTFPIKQRHGLCKDIDVMSNYFQILLQEGIVWLDGHKDISQQNPASIWKKQLGRNCFNLVQEGGPVCVTCRLKKQAQMQSKHRYE